MRIARFAENGRTFFALLEGDDRIRELPDGPFASTASPGSSRPLGDLRPLAPCAPTKILGIGRNYRAHAAEMKHPLPPEPLLFLKPPSAVLSPGEAIRLPRASKRVDYEGEIGVVIGREAHCVPEERALEHVLGFTCVNDVTARDLQETDVQFTRAKGFDTFCPFGPCIVTGLDPEELTVETFVNGIRRQASSASEMIFGIAHLVSYISRVMTLLPGDLIATGTPEGVGALRSGDEVTVCILGVGRLTNRVTDGG